MARSNEVALLLGLTVLSACIRKLEQVEPPESQPSFLGSHSGVYLVTSTSDSTGEPRPVPSAPLFNVIEVGDQLVLAMQENAAIGYGLSMTMPLDRTGPFAVGRLNNASGLLGQSFAIIEVTLTFDSITIGLISPDGTEGCVNGMPCASFELERVCDFDARLSGVYAVTGAATGTCEVGVREIALAAGNGLGDTLVVGLGAEGVLFASLGAFDPFTQSITMSTNLTGPSFAIDPPSFVGTLAFQDEKVAVTSRMVVRGASCESTLEGRIERQVGVQPGISCPSRSTLCSPLGVAACPRIFAQGSYGTVRYDFTLSESLSCPQATCSSTFPGFALCDNARTEMFEACPPGNHRAAASTSSGCINAVCVPNTSKCPEVQLPLGFSYCGRDNTVVVSSDCQTLSCERTLPACETAQSIDCQGLLGLSATLEVDLGCARQACYFPNGAAAAAATLNPELVGMGSYRIARIEDEKIEIAAGGDCPKINTQLFQLACPTNGKPPVPVGTVPADPDYVRPDVTLKLSAEMCFLPAIKGILPRFDIPTSCPNAQVLKCVGLEGGIPRIECKA